MTQKKDYGKVIRNVKALMLKDMRAMTEECEDGSFDLMSDDMGGEQVPVESRFTDTFENKYIERIYIAEDGELMAEDEDGDSEYVELLDTDSVLALLGNMREHEIVRSARQQKKTTGEIPENE